MTIDDLVALLKTLDKWLIVFGVLVAIGVVGEAVVGFIHFRKSSELQRLQTDENLKQQKEIEQLRADNLKLEALIQPRSLTTEKQRMIGESLRVLSGQKVTVLSFATDSEGYQLGEQIVALKMAGMDVLDMNGRSFGGPSGLAGVNINFWMAVDSADSQVFISQGSNGSDSIVVTNLSGKIVGAIAEPSARVAYAPKPAGEIRIEQGFGWAARAAWAAAKMCPNPPSLSGITITATMTVM